MRPFPKQIASGVLALAAILLMTGCFATESSSTPPPSESGDQVSLGIRMGVGGVNALGKSATITLDKLILVLTSSANDTIRDTITSSTTPALSTVSTTAQVISKNYSLKALRSWKIVATSKDTRDSVIHRDSATVPAMYAGDVAAVNLSLSSRFSMYEAKFLSLPDSIRSAGDTLVKQYLCIKRLVLKVDGTAVRDSTTPNTCFADGATHTLAYDYVTVGSHSVQMLAYIASGTMGSWSSTSPVYSGSRTVAVGAGLDSTLAITLDWVGPTTGTGSLSATLGKVGKITINGTLPGTVIP